MKEKISTALKNKYNNLGLSQKAFDGVAAFLIAQKTIEKEEDIETAIAADNIASLLKVFQGESDTIRTAKTAAEAAKAAAEKALEDYKKAHPDKTPDPDDPTAKALKELQDKQAAFEQRIKDEEEKQRRIGILNQLHDLMKEKGSTNDFIRNTVLKDIAVGAEDTADKLLESAQAAYNKAYTEAYGKGPVPPAGGPQNGEYKPGAYNSEVERLRASGKLPKAN